MTTETIATAHCTSSLVFPLWNFLEYRMVAPGLPGGLTAADTSTSPADIKLTDLHSLENLFEFDSSGDDESDGEEAGSSAAAMLPEDGDGVDDVIEELTKVGGIQEVTEACGFQLAGSLFMQ